MAMAPEAELTKTKAMARELARQIEEASARARQHKSELSRSLRRSKKEDERSAGGDGEDVVLRELDVARKELRKLKLDVMSAKEGKKKAEDEAEDWMAKIRADEVAMAEMKRAIEEADEEHAIVELARMEAEKERREIEAQREAEGKRFAEEIASARMKTKALQKEARRAKELEARLAATESDASVLRAEMEMVRAMEMSSAAASSEDMAQLRATEAELEQAKKELAALKDEGFRFMASMDVARVEMNVVKKDAGRLKEKERRAADTIQRLNAKLSKAAAQLQAGLVADERAKAILSNLTSALQQLKSDVEAAKEEKAQIEQEVLSVKAQALEIHLDMATVEEALAARAGELEAAKSSEAAAMKNLQSAVERGIKAKAALSSSSSSRSSTMAISKFEYDYLTRQADMARAVAEKKVTAARAWVDALKAGEKEMALRIEHVEKEIKEAGAKRGAKATAAATLPVEKEDDEMEDQALEPPRKSARASTASRRARMRRISASSVTNVGRSPSFTIVRQKRTVVPNLMKLIRERRAKHKRDDQCQWPR